MATTKTDKPYIWAPNEPCTFYLLNADMTGQPSQIGTVVADPGALRVTVRDACGQTHSIPAGHLWPVFA